MPPSARARTTTTRGFQASAEGLRRSAEHLAHLARRLLGERQVALADGEHVGDLERAGLERLDVVAEPGRTDDDAGVGERGDPRFRLAGADGLDDDAVEAGGVEAVDRRAGRARQAAELAAGGERADEGVRDGRACSPIRIRSPRTAPPLIGLDGSKATTATVQAALRARRRAGRSTSVDLPLPGTPVTPTTRRLPARAAERRRGLARRRARRRRTASAGGRSPAGRRRGRASASSAAGQGGGRRHAVRRRRAAGRSRGRGAGARRSPRC